MRFRLLPTAAPLAIALASALPADAQVNRWSATAVNDQWSNEDNWDTGFTPDPLFDTAAIVGSTNAGAATTATVATSGQIVAPSVILGDGGGTSGTLPIAAGTSFDVLADFGAGDFIVGQNGGFGELIVTGGALTIENALTSASGATGSAVRLSGAASVTVGNAFLDRQLVIEGSGVNFSAITPDSSNNGLILGAGGVHRWVIPATGASTLRVAGNADLGGTLDIEFDGVSPAFGDTWNLIDAAAIDANDLTPTSFGQVVTNADAGLGPGARFAVNAVASGASTNGVFAQLTLEQQPVLVVNRQSGQVAITNPGPVDSAEIDVYVVGSGQGGLDAQAFSGGFSQSSGWFDANVTATAVSELNPNGSGGIDAGGSLSLGAIFAPALPVSFGQENEDVTFRFAKPGGGFIDGEIVYEGLPNNTLVLNVDPATGEAQLINPTGFTVDVDSYTVRSTSGSLRPGDGSWDSLEDQGADGAAWFEANADTNQIAELLTDGGRTLAPNATVSLGSPFGSGGETDLEFLFSIVASSDGDFNGDGSVNAADYTIWRDNLGEADDSVLNGAGDGVPGVSQADYDVWAANYGASGGNLSDQLLTGKIVYSPLVNLGSATGASVPEPTAALLALFVASAALTGRR